MRSRPFARRKKHPTRGCFGAPSEARTHNEGVGGPCFIQLDYRCVFTFFLKVPIFYYFLLSFCKRLWYNISKFRKKFSL